MEFNQQLLSNINYSIVSPFDLYSSNESMRNLTPASAGSLISDELINSSYEAALICIFNAASYSQLSEFLAEFSSVFNIEKVSMIKNACDYMASFEASKRLSNSTIASSIFKTAPIESLNVSDEIFHDVVSDYEVDQELSVDAVAELAELETFRDDLAAAYQANIAIVKESFLSDSNKIFVTGAPDSMAESINSHCEGLPQNTPFTVAVCFAGSLAAVSYINTMIAG